MCPKPVHLVVIRTKLKKAHTYRYFLVFTTDLTLSVETIVHYYDLRWRIETAFRDSKESFGFDHYQVKSETAIQRSIVLSFVGASLTQLMALPKFQRTHPETLPKLRIALTQMNIHWYHPTRWTLGLIVRYIQWQKSRQRFTPCFSADKNSTNRSKPYPVAAG